MSEENSQAQSASLTNDQIQKIVQDAVAAAIKPLGDSLAKQSGGMGKPARERFISKHMKDVPEAYLRQLPDTEDQNVLAKAEQDIRTVLKRDLASFGVKAPNIGSGFSSGEAPTLRQVVDSHRSSADLVGSAIAKSTQRFLSGARPTGAQQAGE